MFLLSDSPRSRRLRPALHPSKADTPLIVDPDAHLPRAVSLEGFEPIARRIAQIVDRERGLDLAKLAQCAILNLAEKLAARLALPNTFGVLALERPDH